MKIMGSYIYKQGVKQVKYALTYFSEQGGF